MRERVTLTAIVVLLAAVLFDAVGGGAANLAITGTATAPGGTPATLQITPVPTIAVR